MMTKYPFVPEELSDAARTLLTTKGPTQHLSLANQLRSDAEAGQNPSHLIALAWTLTEIVESGVHVDDLWNDIQEAQKALDTALALDPELERSAPFVAQRERTGIVHDRVYKFEQKQQAKVSKAKAKSDSDLSAEEAADIAYRSKDPEDIAHYFLLAAQKSVATHPRDAAWYLNGRTGALLDLSRWDEAEPHLRRMTQGDASDDFWVELGYVGLLRIAAAKSDGRTFKKLWRQARSASPAIPGVTPTYYRVLRFGVEQDLFDFVDPVVRKLAENEHYEKTKEDQEVLELASNYIQQKSLQTNWSKLRSYFRFRK